MRPSLVHPAPDPAPIATYVRGRRAEARPVVLDLGCGARKTAGAFGIDGVRLPGVDLVHDLESRPYPLPDDCADEVVLHHVLEHFADPLRLMEEVWRVTRAGGRVHIRTPHYSGPYAWIDPTHRRTFTLRSFDYFGDRFLSPRGLGYYSYDLGSWHIIVLNDKGDTDPQVNGIDGTQMQWLSDDLNAHPNQIAQLLLIARIEIEPVHSHRNVLALLRFPRPARRSPQTTSG